MRYVRLWRRALPCESSEALLLGEESAIGHMRSIAFRYFEFKHVRLVTTCSHLLALRNGCTPPKKQFSPAIFCATASKVTRSVLCST